MRSLLLVAACLVCTTALAQQPPETTEEFKQLPRDLQKAMVAGVTVETIDFDVVTVDVHDDILMVQGRTNTPRKVYLVPHRHEKKPDYWVYEVVAEAETPQKANPQMWTKAIKMSGFKGTKGIEVYGGYKFGKEVVPKAVRVVVK